MPEKDSGLTLQYLDLVKEYRRGDWGFTGTRAGMTAVQHDWCKRWTRDVHPLVWRHGGAYGSDTQLHAIWKDTKYPSKVFVYPADDKRRRQVLHQKDVFVEQVMDPLVRNEIIVDKSTLLLATPHTQHEIIRSGTWHTIRCAIRAGKPVIIVWPNGKQTLHRDKVLYRIVDTLTGTQP
jgi:hypothetical protein